MKTLNLLLAVILSVGCASSPIVNRTQDDIDLSVRKSGLYLTSVTQARYALLLTISNNKEAVFSQLIDQLPGDNLLYRIQPLKINSGEDCVIGVNGKADWTSFEELENAFRSAIAGNRLSNYSIVQILTKNGEIKNLIVGGSEAEIFNRMPYEILIAPHKLVTTTSEVWKVQPGSWAEKLKLQQGDELIGKATLRTRKYLLRSFPLTGESKKNETRLISSDNIGEIKDALNEAFGNYQSKNLKELHWLLRVKVIRNNEFRTVELTLPKFFGTGTYFDCSKVKYCLNAPPYIAKVPENSPADLAGLKEGDLVVEINGRRFDNVDRVMNFFKKTRLGDELTFVVLRDAQPIIAKVKVDWIYDTRD